MTSTQNTLLAVTALLLASDQPNAQDPPAFYSYGLTQRPADLTAPVQALAARLSGHGLPDLCLLDAGELFLITAPGIHESDGPVPLIPDGPVRAVAALVDFPYSGADGLVLATDSGLCTWSYVDDQPSLDALGILDGEAGVRAASVSGSSHAFLALSLDRRRATTYAHDGSSWAVAFVTPLPEPAFDVACGDWTGDGTDELAVCDSRGLHVVDLSSGAMLYDESWPASSGRVSSLPWGPNAVPGFAARFAWAAPLSAVEDRIVAVGPPAADSELPMRSVCSVGGRTIAGLSGTLTDLNDYPDIVVASATGSETLLLFDMAIYGGFGYGYELGATWIVPYTVDAPGPLTCNGWAADFDGDSTVDLLQPLASERELAHVPGVDFAFGGPPPEDSGGGLVQTGGEVEPGGGFNEWQLRLSIDTDAFPPQANALDVVAWDAEWTTPQTPHLSPSSVQRSITAVEPAIGLQSIDVPDVVVRGEQLGVSETGTPLSTLPGSYVLLVRPVVRHPTTGRVLEAFEGAIGLVSWDAGLIQNSINLPESQAAVVIGGASSGPATSKVDGGLLVTFVYRPCAPPADPPQSVFVPSAP